ncbi:MAG: DMT family transporter [Acidobacteriota bacterium]|nr:DMT family transporter [Acidobacteriota bacterium]MDE3190791.1 DMT family transporter [Acidobacteriota bacterium]
MAPAYALLASLTWGVGDYIGGLKSRLMPALVVMAVSQPFGLAALAVAVAVRGTAPPGPEVAWAALAALFGTAGLVGFYRGMAAGAISVVVPLAAIAAGIPVVWGLVHGDNVSFLQGVGFIAALGGGLMASIERGGERPRFAAGTGWAILALLGFGFYFIPLHASATHDWLWPSFVFRATSVTLVWAALLLTRQRPAGTRPHLAALAAIGLLDTGGNTLFAAASSSHGLISVVSVLASLYPAVTVLLARLALGERVERTQDIGVLVTLAGVVLISAG